MSTGSGITNSSRLSNSSEFFLPSSPPVATYAAFRFEAFILAVLICTATVGDLLNHFSLSLFSFSLSSHVLFNIARRFVNVAFALNIFSTAARFFAHAFSHFCNAVNCSVGVLYRFSIGSFALPASNKLSKSPDTSSSYTFSASARSLSHFSISCNASANSASSPSK